jgi:hypothetical protein
MPQTYDKLGVHFLYPDNWQLTDEQASESPYAVTLQTPQGGLWVLQVHLEGDPMELAAEGLKTMREEYPELEADSIVDQVEGLDVVGFEMRFYYLDFVAMATIVSFAAATRSSSSSVRLRTATSPNSNPSSARSSSAWRAVASSVGACFFER